jgi:biotin carboxyl carrier protein
MELNYQHQDEIHKVDVEKNEEGFRIKYLDKAFDVVAEELKPGYFQMKLNNEIFRFFVSIEGDMRFVFINGDIFRINKLKLLPREGRKGKKAKGDLNSPISGKVIRVMVNEGDIVKDNQPLMIIEAMKMEHQVRAPYPGEVKKINFKEGQQVDVGELLMDVEASKEE